MYKSMTLLVLVALAACAFAMEAQDQEAAEQYYRIHGVYPSWYQYGVNAFNGFAFFRPPSFNLLRLNADRVDYSAASYPSDFFVGVRNVAHPYAIEAAAENQYGAATYSNGFRGYPFAGYPSAVYPSISVTAPPAPIAAPVAYPYATYPFGFNTYPYATYGAVPYVAAAPAAAPAKA